jgi:hypothetical protein
VNTAHRVAVLAGLALAAAGPAPAAAQTIGPVCFSLAPHPNFFVLFLTPHAGNQFTVTGRDMGVGDRPLVGTGVLTGSTFNFGFSLHAVGAAHPSSLGGAAIDVQTGSGPGFARPVDGVGTSFLMAIAPCPPQATQ